MAKRLFDVLFSAAALLAFLPFGLIIAAVLKVTGEGEVFYRQQRVGKDGKLFGVLKFATMLEGSEKMGTGLLTVTNDPRVLPFGVFLRKTKLNEVPQLWNVLKGEMSIIGPRPQAQPHFDLFSPSAQKEILTVRPGLSGIGSIVFRNEEEMLGNAGSAASELYARDIAKHKGELEVWYVRNRAFVKDIVLILLTVGAVLLPNVHLYRRIFPDLPQSGLEELPF